MACNHTAYGSGVYTITHTPTGRVYVGRSWCVGCRWRMHRHQLRRNKHGNHNLQKCWDEGGAWSLTFQVVEACEVPILVEREQHWIDTLRSQGGSDLLNMSPNARSRQGARLSDAAKKRIGDAKKNPSALTRERLRQGSLGKTRSPEVCKAISDHHRFNKISQAQADEIREKYDPWTPQGKGRSPALPNTVTLAKEYGVASRTITKILRREGKKFA